MKKTITFSLITGAILFSGCAVTGISIEKAKKEGGVREYIAQEDRIFADRDDKTLFYTYSRIAGNPPPMLVGDVTSIRDKLKEYCEKGLGGKWEDGKRYHMLMIHSMFRHATLLNKSPKTDGLGVCIAPNGKGYKAKELGLFSFNIDWEITKSLGGGDRVSWRRYYEIEYDTPNKPKKDYVAYSFKSYFGDKYGKIKEMVKYYKGIANYDKGSQTLLETHPLCRSGGGKVYIATDEGTGMKKVDMNDYLIAMFDYLYKKNKDKKEKLYHQYIMFPVDKKGYIWCENPNNKDNEFMLIWNGIRFDGIDYIRKDLISNLEEDKDFTAKDIKNIKDSKTTPKLANKLDDKKVENIAKSVFSLKGNVNISNDPYVKYYGTYIGKIGDCEYTSVEKKDIKLSKIYNFKKCNDEIKFTGQTLKGLSVNEYKKIKFNLNELKRNCAVDGVALMQVDGYNLYCRSNKNGGFKIFILDDKYQLRDVLE